MWQRWQLTIVLLMCTSLSQHCHYHWCHNAVFVLPTLLVRRISLCYVCKLRLKVWLIRKKLQKHFFCWSQSDHVERWFVKKIRNNLKRGPKTPQIYCTYSIFLVKSCALFYKPNGLCLQWTYWNFISPFYEESNVSNLCLIMDSDQSILVVD